jgi:hypothetical protein
MGETMTFMSVYYKKGLLEIAYKHKVPQINMYMKEQAKIIASYTKEKA